MRDDGEAEEYGREEWSTDPDAAYREAERRIARVRADPSRTSLFLSDLSALKALPPELSECAHLEKLTVGDAEVPDGRGYDRSRRIEDWSSLCGLFALKSLRAGDSGLTDLSPLSGLTALQVLDCLGNRLTDLSPLSGLTALRKLNCSFNQLTDLSPLSGLTALQTLYCSDNELTDLSPLSGLTALQTLYCSRNPLTDLSPLSGLTALQELHCSGNQLTDLSPLSGLTALRKLNCSFNQLTDLSPLSGLTALRWLNCSRNQLTDLSPLSGLTALLELDCSGNGSCEGPHLTFWMSGALKRFTAYGTELAGIPQEVLSHRARANCLPHLRAHLEDLGENPESLTDIKLMVLGNGRIGKTQIVRRLRDEPYERDADSTHGIITTMAGVPHKNDHRFAVWDFGGQDIYHGTHALFLKSRAVFLVVWTRGSENAETHVHNGMTFRNQPFVWWLDFVRRYGDESAPLIVVQNQIDREQQEAEPPEVSALRTGNRFVACVNYSACEDTNRGILNGALSDAAKRFNPPLIGPGRLKVMRDIQALIEADQTRPAAERQHRTMPFDAFVARCEATGQVSDPKQFLAFLHNAGVVFWREGLFDDSLVLDQGWMLEAVYTVFHRDKCLTHLKRYGGRFYASELHDLIWGEAGYSQEEQALFLQFMRSCGIVFVVDWGNEWGTPNANTRYVAPDLLPEDWSPQKRAALWGGADAEHTHVRTYRSLPPALMRNLICRIGTNTGEFWDYWRDGFSGYEQKTGSHILVEQDRNADWSGTITLQTRSGKSAEMMETLLEIVRDEEQRLALSPDESALEEKHPPERRATGETTMTPGVSSEKPREYYVSYAWADDRSEAGRTRAEIVDAFCERARERGIEVIRDREAMKVGDRISTFMKRLSRGDRVFVVLSDKYLKSSFCMTELHEIWRQARGEPERFLKRVRLFTLGDAKIWDELDRAVYARYWREQKARLDDYITEHSADDLSDKGMASLRLMRRFSTEVPEMLDLIADTLQARDIEALGDYPFDDDYDEDD